MPGIFDSGLMEQKKRHKVKHLQIELQNFLGQKSKTPLNLTLWENCNSVT